MTEVMLVDDHALFRKGLRSLIETAPGLSVVAEATDAASAVPTYIETMPDVVLLDMKFPDGDGLDVLRRMLAADPGAKVIMLSAFDFEEQVTACMKAGARGYLSKDLNPDELFRSIETVQAGGIALGASHLSSLLSSTQGSAHKNRECPLTAREYEVAALVAQGMTNREIAATLFLSPLTIKAHLAGSAHKNRECPLTAREYEVAALVAQGMTNREIAATLFLSPLTIKAHLANMLTKLGLHGRAELASWFTARQHQSPPQPGSDNRYAR